MSRVAVVRLQTNMDKDAIPLSRASKCESVTTSTNLFTWLIGFIHYNHAKLPRLVRVIGRPSEIEN